MKKQKLLLVLLSLLGLLSNCAHVEEIDGDTGPIVTGCVVDVKAGGYQCAAPNKTPFFLSFQDAAPLDCMLAVDLEDAFKSCAKGKAPVLKICTVSEQKVLCPDRASPELKELDNYYCMSAQDTKRVLERCDSGG